MGPSEAVAAARGAETVRVPAEGPAGSSRSPRTLVILPALDEEDSLAGVLAELRSTAPELDVLVVDDGSTDGTAAVARAAGVRVAPLPFNLGIGGALQTGFLYAVRHGYDRALQFDADGQHDATQIPILLAALDAGADLVIGSRFADQSHDYEVGRLRAAGMRVLSIAVRMLSGQSFSDTSSGFRAFSAPMLAYYASRYPTEYLDSPEALLLACSAGFEVAEVRVHMRERAGGSPSTRNVKLVYHYLRVLVTMLGRAPIRRHPTRLPASR